MTMFHIHPHAACDRYPALLASFVEEYGADTAPAFAAQFAAAEAADLHWESRFGMRSLGRFEGFDDDEDGTDGTELMRIIGFFRGCYFVANCLVDSEMRVHALLKLTRFDDLAAAQNAFRHGGG